MQVPVLAFFSMIFFPLLSVYDILIPGNFTGSNSETDHIYTSVASVEFLTWEAYVFYGSFYLIMGLVLGVLKHLWNLEQEKKRANKDTFRPSTRK